MKSRKWLPLVELAIIIIIICLLLAVALPQLCRAGWLDPPPQPKSASGVERTTVKLDVGSDGMTAEQRNIKGRLTEDNKPGSIKHLYVISAYSGQTIIYSTVRGKVTSGGKRLSPTTVAVQDGQYVGSAYGGFNLNIGGQSKATGEVIQDDGTFGSSDPYIYWWDTKGVYHQHYVSGGQIIHVSNQPIAVKSIIMNLETAE